MSLYLIELKIKTALELVDYIDSLVEDRCLVKHLEASLRDLDRTTTRLRGVLREIINRPKEEGSNNG